jgi:hypothetical protein
LLDRLLSRFLASASVSSSRLSPELP